LYIYTSEECILLVKIYMYPILHETEYMISSGETSRA